MTEYGLRIKWDGESNFDVRVPQMFQRNVCGLLGNYDGNPDNDLIMREGKVVRGYSNFISEKSMYRL